MPNQIPPRTAHLILVLEGFVSISVQVLLFRLLIPLVGSSVIVTSLIIAVFLASLAVGYKHGGEVKKPLETLRRNLLLSCMLIGLGLSYPVLNWLFTKVLIPAGLPALVALLVYLILVIAPLVYLLGQTLPILTNYFRGTGAPEIAGRALFCSTLGSVLGCVLSSLVLMTYLGVATTVAINLLLLAALFLFIAAGAIRPEQSAIILAGVLAIAWFFHIGPERENFVESNSYANYEVVKDPFTMGRSLVINNSHASYASPLGTHRYIQRLRSLVLDDLGAEGKSILVLGAGGFSFSAHGTHGADIIYVDIDPAIKTVAEKHFLGSSIKGRFVAADARLYLLRERQQWDVIISDVYSSKFSIPWHLLTKEYMQAVAERLKPGGYAIFNVLMNPRLDTTFSRRVDNTIRSAFGNCVTDIEGLRAGPSNVLYICRKGRDRTVYRDGQSRETLDEFIHERQNLATETGAYTYGARTRN